MTRSTALLRRTAWRPARRVCADRGAELVVGTGITTRDARSSATRRAASVPTWSPRWLVPTTLRRSEPDPRPLRGGRRRSPVPLITCSVPYRTGRGLGASALLELAAIQNVASSRPLRRWTPIPRPARRQARRLRGARRRRPACLPRCRWAARARSPPPRISARARRRDARRGRGRRRRDRASARRGAPAARRGALCRAHPAVIKALLHAEAGSRRPMCGCR